MTKRLLIRFAYIIEETKQQRSLSRHKALPTQGHYWFIRNKATQAFVSIHSHVATPTPLINIINLFSGRDRRASLSFSLRLLIRSAYIIEETKQQRSLCRHKALPTQRHYWFIRNKATQALASVHSHVTTPTSPSPDKGIIDLFRSRVTWPRLCFRPRPRRLQPTGAGRLQYKSHAFAFLGISVSIENSTMKTFQLSDDRIVVVKKQQGQLTVTMKQKDSLENYIEFPPSRWIARSNTCVSVCKIIFIFFAFDT